MADFKPRDYLYGIIFMFLFLSGGIFIFNSFATDNPAMYNDDFNQVNRTLAKMQTISTTINQTKTNVFNNNQSTGTISNPFDSLISLTWGSIKLLPTTFGFMEAVFSDFSNFLGLPTWIPATLFLIIFVMMIFTVFSAIFQSDL